MILIIRRVYDESLTVLSLEVRNNDNPDKLCDISHRLPLINEFIHSFISSFVRSFVRSFIPLRKNYFQRRLEHSFSLRSVTLNELMYKIQCNEM